MPNSRACALLAIFALSLVSCNRGGRKRIAVVPKGTSSIFWLAVEAGAMAAGDQYKVDILWNGPPMETEYDRQIQIVDSYIAQRVDGLAVAAGDRKALDHSINEAAALGIPVTVFDSGVDTTNYMTFIATDNYAAGKMAGEEMGRLLNGKGTVALVMHAPGSQSTMARESGFEDALKASFPGIRIVARQYGLSDRAKAMASAENILTAHADLDGIFASSEPSSTGTALAIKSRGLAGKVKFVAFDSSDSMIEDMKAGVINAMVVQDPFHMGFEVVKSLVDKLHGITPPKRVDLNARVIHKADLDNPEVQKLLKPDVKKYLK